MTTGIALAGGASRRFVSPDGTSKLDAYLGGRSVLDRTIDAVAAVCDEVIVAGRPSGPREDVVYVTDAAPFEGPLGGIAAGLQAATNDAVVIVGGDTPLAHPAVLAILAKELLDAAVDAAVLADGKDWRPLPLGIRLATARPAIDAAFDRGERSIRRMLAALRIRVIPERAWRLLDPEGDTFLDIDTPDDLAEARRRLTR